MLKFVCECVSGKYSPLLVRVITRMFWSVISLAELSGKAVPKPVALHLANQEPNVISEVFPALETAVHLQGFMTLCLISLKCSYCNDAPLSISRDLLMFSYIRMVYNSYISHFSWIISNCLFCNTKIFNASVMRDWRRFTCGCFSIIVISNGGSKVKC